jgi:hypothetical protein
VSVGGGNPLPFEVGGGPTTAEQAHKFLKSAVGVGGSSPDDESIEAQWRFARARGVVAAFADERAVSQAFPDRATDYIPVYEDILALSSGGLSDEDRRLLILDRWIAGLSAVTDELETELQEIDPLFSIVEIDRDDVAVTEPGRGFEDWNPASGDAAGPAFGGGRSSTEWPNFSRDFICYVEYALGSGPITAENERRIERAKTVLNNALPSWVSFSIYTTDVGFILDQDVLDITAFGP